LVSCGDVDRWGWKSVDRTNAWVDDDKSGSYMLHFCLERVAPKRTSTTATWTGTARRGSAVPAGHLGSSGTVPPLSAYIAERSSTPKPFASGTSVLGAALETCRLSTVDRNLECLTDLQHPHTAQCADPLGQYRSRHRLDRVKVHRAAAPDRVLAGFQHDLARQTSDRGCAWRDERTSEPRNCDITRQHDDWSPTKSRRLTPPQLTSERQ